MLLSGINHIGHYNGLHNKNDTTPVPPPQFGIIGEPNNLALSFSNSPNVVVAVSFTAGHTANIYEQLIRAFCNTTPGRMYAAVYDKTGADTGNNIAQAPGFQNLGLLPEILTFNQNKNILAGSDYWLAYQCSEQWEFYYEDSTPITNYIYLGGFPEGVLPASFGPGDPLFPVVCQFWGNYVY